MTKKYKNYAFNFGDPEVVLNREEAVDLIRSRLTFVPRNDASTQIDTWVARVVADKYNLEGSPSEQITTLAEATITKLSGPDDQFTHFTAESLLTLNRDVFHQLVGAELESEDFFEPFVDSTIQDIPALNDKTFTSVQTLHLANELLIDGELSEFTQHFSNVRIPSRWAKQEDNRIVPNGVDHAKVLIDVNGPEQGLDSFEDSIAALESVNDEMLR